MRHQIPSCAIALTAVLALSACTGSGDSEGGTAADKAPAPVPAAKLDDVALPKEPAKLAALVQDRMGEALTVSVGIELTPDQPETDPIEETSLDLRMSDPPAATMQVVESDKETPTTTDIVILDNVIYTKMPKGQALVEGKPWMRLSQKEVDEAKEQIGPFAEIFTIILDESTNALKEASGGSSLDLIRYGELTSDPTTADKDGQRLTTYKGETDAQKLSDIGDETYSDLADQGLETVSWTMTVTEKGLPTELGASILSPKGDPATTTVKYADWGKKVDVKAPPKSQTGTLKESLRG